MSRLNSTLEPFTASAAVEERGAISPATATTLAHPGPRHGRAGPGFDLVATTTGISPIEARRGPIGLRPPGRHRGCPILTPTLPRSSGGLQPPGNAASARPARPAGPFRAEARGASRGPGRRW